MKKSFTLQKTTAVNSSLTLMSSVKLAPDCTPQKFDDQIEIVQQPQHGRVETTTESIFPQFPMGIPQYGCNAKRVPARVITYTPDKDYAGPDSVTTESVDKTSDLTRLYAITVK